MSTLIATAKTNFDPIEEGVHVGTCIKIIDLGQQYSEKFNNSSWKCLLLWELPFETIEVEKDGVKKELPRHISAEYAMSLSEKSNFRKMLEAWRGAAFTAKELEGFDITSLLGKNCQIQVNHKEKNGKTFAQIAAIMSMPKGQSAIEPTVPTKIFEFSKANHTINTINQLVEDFKELPEWIQNKIKESRTTKDNIGFVELLDKYNIHLEENKSNLPAQSGRENKVSFTEAEELYHYCVKHNKDIGNVLKHFNQVSFADTLKENKQKIIDYINSLQ